MFQKSISLTLILTFAASLITPISRANASDLLGLPIPGTMVSLSPAYKPVIIKGVTVHPDNPFLFDFIVDLGDQSDVGNGRDRSLQDESTKLVNYFLASLAIGEKDLWVNLSPYEKNRIVPQALGQTEMGRDLLAQDYILKQITASLIYPETGIGKKFWDRIYQKSQERYGKNVDIPVNVFNKVWIMADRAKVFERNNSAFVVDSHLKVMLEEDYLAYRQAGLAANMRAGDAKAEPFSARSASEDGGGAAAAGPAHVATLQIIRDIILPELEKEVNEGKNFANLRQIFHAIILSSWFKKTLKESLLGKLYADKSNVKGIDLKDNSDKEKIYDRYLEAYKKGVFNYVKEEGVIANPKGEAILNRAVPRKYFSGGVVPGAASPAQLVVTHNNNEVSAAMTAISDRAMRVSAAVKPVALEVMGRRYDKSALWKMLSDTNKIILNPKLTAEQRKVIVLNYISKLRNEPEILPVLKVMLRMLLIEDLSDDDFQQMLNGRLRKYLPARASFKELMNLINIATNRNMRLEQYQLNGIRNLVTTLTHIKVLEKELYNGSVQDSDRVALFNQKMIHQAVKLAVCLKIIDGGDKAMLSDADRQSLRNLDAAWTLERIRQEKLNVLPYIAGKERAIENAQSDHKYVHAVPTMQANLALLKQDAKLLEVAEAVLLDLSKVKRSEQLSRKEIWKAIQEIFPIKNRLTNHEEKAVSQYLSGEKFLTQLLGVVNAKLDGLPMNISQSSKFVDSVGMFSTYQLPVDFLKWAATYVQNNNSNELVKNLEDSILELDFNADLRLLRHDEIVRYFLGKLGIDAGDVIQDDSAMTHTAQDIKQAAEDLRFLIQDTGRTGLLEKERGGRYFFTTHALRSQLKASMDLLLVAVQKGYLLATIGTAGATIYSIMQSRQMAEWLNKVIETGRIDAADSAMGSSDADSRRQLRKQHEAYLGVLKTSTQKLKAAAFNALVGFYDNHYELFEGMPEEERNSIVQKLQQLNPQQIAGLSGGPGKPFTMLLKGANSAQDRAMQAASFSSPGEPLNQYEKNGVARLDQNILQVLIQRIRTTGLSGSDRKFVEKAKAVDDELRGLLWEKPQSSYVESWINDPGIKGVFKVSSLTGETMAGMRARSYLEKVFRMPAITQEESSKYFKELVKTGFFDELPQSYVDLPMFEGIMRFYTWYKIPLMKILAAFDEHVNKKASFNIKELTMDVSIILEEQGVTNYDEIGRLLVNEVTGNQAPVIEYPTDRAMAAGSSASQDAGMIGQELKGGIDLQTSQMKWDISREGNGIDLGKIDQAQMARYLKEGIESLTPRIIGVERIHDVWAIFGMTPR